MNSDRPVAGAAIAVSLTLMVFMAYRHSQYLSDIKILGVFLLLEILIISVWKFRERYFVLLLIAYLWAGLNVPLHAVWTSGRWALLGAGACVGALLWMRGPLRSSGWLHLTAFFCACAAFVAASVSPFVRMSSLKALSLFLLFLYCATGVRLAVLGREEKFFRGLLWGCEVVVYGSAICYLGLGTSIWGNPNSLGAVVSIVAFPVLLWGWFTSDNPGARLRRVVALLLCAYLIRITMARAAMIAVALVIVVFCSCLRQYKILLKVAALGLLVVAIAGMLVPNVLITQLADVADALLYKGHREEGLLGSRQSPWEQSVAAIKAHPFFGTGYGTSPNGMDPGLDFGTVSSNAQTAREHGSSYMGILEWEGMVGVIPFVALLAVTMSTVWKVCAWMRQTGDARHYSIPLAMIVLAGLLHACFEDWLFAPGSYLCLFFWAIVFVLADLVPRPALSFFPAVQSPPLSPGFGAVVPTPGAPGR